MFSPRLQDNFKPIGRPKMGNCRVLIKVSIQRGVDSKTSRQVANVGNFNKSKIIAYYFHTTAQDINSIQFLHKPSAEDNAT